MHKKFLIGTFFLFWLTYAVFVNPQLTSMSLAMLQTTINVVDKQSLALSPQTSADIIEVEGEYYSSYAPGSWILPLPYYLILKAGMDNLPSKIPNFKTYSFKRPSVVSKEAFYLHLFVVLFLLCPLSALLLVQIEKFAFRQGASSFKALSLAGLVGYGTLMFNYTEFYSIRSLACLIIFNTVFWHLNYETKKSFQFGLTGILFGLAICTDYLAVLLAIISSVFILRKSVKREIFQFAIGLSVMLCALGYYHYFLYENPFLTPYHFRVIRLHDFTALYKGQIYHSIDYQQGILLGLSLPNLKTMSALLFSPFKGIFVYCPILLVGLWGHGIGLKKNSRPSLTFYALGLFITYLLFNSSLKGELYWSGWPRFFGPRYLLATIPFMVLGIMHFKWNKLRIIIVSVFASFSIFFNLLGAMLQDTLWETELHDPILLNFLNYGVIYIIEHGPRIPLLANYHVHPGIQYVLFSVIIFIWASALINFYSDNRVE